VTCRQPKVLLIALAELYASFAGNTRLDTTSLPSYNLEKPGAGLSGY
jgi:hypothetical protein